MADQPPGLPLLQQREIEARIVGPLIRAFAAEVGEERAIGILRGVITGLARQGGAGTARSLGEHGLEAFARSLDRWRENDALEIDMLEQSAERLSFNVVRCRYAELYRRWAWPNSDRASHASAISRWPRDSARTSSSSGPRP